MTGSPALQARSEADSILCTITSTFTAYDGITLPLVYPFFLAGLQRQKDYGPFHILL